MSGISITGDTVTYDAATNTYTLVFPLDAESTNYTAVYSGKNLAYYKDANNVLLRETLTRVGSADTVDQFALNSYNSYNHFTYRVRLPSTLSRFLRMPP